MTDAMTTRAIDAAADRLLASLASRCQMPPLTSEPGGLSLPDAARIARAVTARRVAGGERVVGRKIGFTNRSIWAEYGVSHPIHAPMYDTTVREEADAAGNVSLGRFVEPRIEPEIVLGLAAAPAPGMDERALIGCVGWIAHGFEIVQSLFPGWRFGGADCVAAFGLHGALLCGPRREVAGDRADMLRRLESFEIMLSRDGAAIDQGHARNVLGGPVSALRHLVEAIAADREAAPLQAGDMITTGTLTRAFPLAAGERWTTALTGIDLPGLDVAFTA
jgi:2-oxo-3-hexenedioate decarboxylase